MFAKALGASRLECPFASGYLTFGDGPSIRTGLLIRVPIAALLMLSAPPQGGIEHPSHRTVVGWSVAKSIGRSLVGWY